MNLKIKIHSIKSYKFKLNPFKIMQNKKKNNYKDK